MPKFQDDKSMKRGDYNWFTTSAGVSAYKWCDKRTVHLLSNFHNPNETTEVKRKTKDGTSENVPCPKVLTDYNKYMNSVDKFDQMRTVYGLDRKSKKWWHRIMFFFLDAAVVNAYVLYTLSDEAKMSMKEFRLNITDNLVADKMVKILQVKTLQNSVNQIPIQIKRHKPHQAEAIRLTQSAHQPIRATRRRCAICSSKEFEVRTNWLCSVCQVPLCLGKNKSCFQKYHLK